MDNLPITQVWQAGTTNCKVLMQLVRKLYLIAAQAGFSISLKHILGVHNPIADALSRFQVTKFRQLAPHTEATATKIPATVTNLIQAIQDSL